MPKFTAFQQEQTPGKVRIGRIESSIVSSIIESSTFSIIESSIVSTLVFFEEDAQLGLDNRRIG
jgi:hypothetical protein